MLTSLSKHSHREDEGFTLIELLVVVVIIGILIAIAIPLYLNYQKGAKDKSAQSDLRGVIAMLEQCNADNASYPAVADLPTSGGTVGASCTGATVKTSSGTTLYYAVTTANTINTAYFIQAQNTSGSKKVYCYSSVAGGSVKGLTTTTLATAYASSC